MSPALAWLCGGLLALGIVLFPLSVGAAPPPVETVHLRYSAARTCPSEDEFVSALRRDTDAFRLALEDEARRLVDVDLEVLDGTARGRFRFVDRAHGTAIERELTGPDCEAVARALALMLALAMHRLSEPEPSGEPSDAAPEPTDARDQAPAPQPASNPPRTAPGPTAAPPQVQAHRRHRVSVDLQGELTGAVVREILPFVAMTLQVQPVGWRFRPAVGLSVRQSLPKEISVAGGEATFLWTAGALRLCPHVIAIGAFDVAPCVEAALGRLRADAHRLPAARSSTELWSDGRALVAARWHVSARWYLTTTAAVTAAFTRARFELSSGALISQTPAVGLGGGIGVGLDL
ncbi:MAG: hypothetical protein JWM74_5315 [Myxococcaceae bacterium]|nr:hypothetical protein [Myxococcaceae bacterium]